MKIKFNENSLTFKIWKYFVVFTISIFIILWVMQVILLQSYYSSMKKSETLKIVNELEAVYNESNFVDIMETVAYKNATSIYLFDMSGNLIYGASGTFSKDRNYYNSTYVDIASIINKLQTTDKASYTFHLDKFKSEIYVYAKKIVNTDKCIVLVTSIDPIDATTNVLKSQLSYVTLLTLLISSIISIFISKRLSMPISKMNETAKKLGQGNYNIKFEKAGYSEMDDLADTLNKATHELAQTDKIRRELIANVSHDLKTPLTMIKAYSEMIRDLSGDNKQKREEHLKVIIDETDRLTRLVSDMLDLSKMEAGAENLNKEKFDIVECIRAIIERLKILGQNNNIEILVTGQEKTLVIADKTKIQQVLYNLIINAINHAGEDMKVEVKVTSTSKKVKIKVIDNGSGIPEEDLSHIWSRYYKVNNNFKRSNSGTGLGLAIVKNILDCHKSNYGVNSKLNGGTTFYFDLERGK